MIASHPSLRRSSLITPSLFVGAVVLVSLTITGAVVMMEVLAIFWTALVAICLLTLRQPRYGLYAAVSLSLGLEPQDRDPFTIFGPMFHEPVSAWTPYSFVILSPLELLVLVTAISVLVRAIIERRGLVLGQLGWATLIFLGMITLSIGWGVARGGNFNYAMHETRSLYIAGLIIFLTPRLLTARGHVHQLIRLVCTAVVLMSIQTIWRRHALVDTGEIGLPVEFAFSHEGPLFINFVILLFVARLVWPATGRQKLAALLIPVLVYAEMVTERRAGWVSLDIGLILIAIFTFRMRRRVFYFIVLPLTLFYLGYLAAFWNASGPIAQPARAIRSINDPEGRDISSNWARIIERANVRLNIKANPIAGLGFGKEYIFYYSMPDLSFWPFWHYIPHNSLMFLWMDGGPVTFIAFLTLVGAGIVRGVQLLKLSTDDHTSPFLVAAVSFLVMFVTFCYVDIGMTNSRNTVIFGLVLGVIGMWGRQAVDVPRSSKQAEASPVKEIVTATE